MVIWHLDIKMAITSERFELEPRIENHFESLTETHLSEKLQSDRANLNFVGCQNAHEANLQCFRC